MDTGTVINIARQTVWIIVKTAVPVLLVSMIVGLVIRSFCRHLHLFRSRL